MQRIDGHLVLSPTDLTKHVACAHITTLDLEALDAGAARASGVDDSLNLVFTKGLAHERDYLERLRRRGTSRGGHRRARSQGCRGRGGDGRGHAPGGRGRLPGDLLRRALGGARRLPAARRAARGGAQLLRRLALRHRRHQARPPAQGARAAPDGHVCRPARDAPRRAAAVADRRHRRPGAAPVAPRRRRALCPASSRRAARCHRQPARDRVGTRPALRAVPVEGPVRAGVARP